MLRDLLGLEQRLHRDKKIKACLMEVIKQAFCIESIKQVSQLLWMVAEQG